MHKNATSYVKYSASAAEWIGLIAIFLMAGVIGHDPWKQDETYSFGIIYHFYTTHSWLVPFNGDAPFMEKPPLYYWTGVLFCKLFGGLVPLHDAARLTSVFYMGISCLFMWKLSQALFRHCSDRGSMSWAALALLLGSLGLVRHAHDMFTDVALLTGSIITLYGIALLITAQERWKEAGLWLGLGIGIAFMSKGLFAPVMLCVSGIAIAIMLPELHRRNTCKTALLAIMVASPFLFIWPLLLYHFSPPLFIEWFWYNNVGRFLGFSVKRLGAANPPHYFLHALLWFAFPAFPLACVAAIRNRAQWRSAAYLLPFTVSVTGICFLLASASGRALYLLPLLPALALLAAQALRAIPALWLTGWNRAVCIIAGILTVLIWLSWWNLLHPFAAEPLPQLTGLYAKWLLLDFTPAGSQVPTCIFASILTAFLIMAFRLDMRSYTNTAYLWLVSVAVLWGISHTLLLPWIDETRSYRPLFSEMEIYLQASPYARDCIGNYRLGESITPMLEYFDPGRRLVPASDPSSTACPLLLTHTTKNAMEPMDERWDLIWKQSRALDAKDEELRLYSRKR